ncbi:septum formation protein Maf [Sphingomonas paeninsulae]|jgi:septum formation protein|uniref:Nucleoside triphosphate pyrophosphatase n=1 Tax=Sphingomonas paeninsulae TaxID=2319844 RepID=A0A494TI25_SPHPE|nr:Maf family protein [Sphingomonas paeninsulae]AYJ86613.1 septum formation protein Maf [Sphingomonas paeninsulae]
MTIVLASLSAARRTMLTAAGVIYDAVAAGVDEEAAKQALRADGLAARDLADALAELKAVRISARRPGDLVLGCDQTLALDDGTMLDKPGTALAEQLRLLSGRTHSLYSAIVAAENGQPIWRSVDRVKLTVRPLSEVFIADYVLQEGEFVAGCVGGYRIEGLGAQLFSKIEGSHFTILGLPLLQLLDWLRSRGMMPS